MDEGHTHPRQRVGLGIIPTCAGLVSGANVNQGGDRTYSISQILVDKVLLENPIFTWRRVGLRPRWCGNGPMLCLKSIEVGLNQVGCDQRRFGGEFWRFFVIFGHFWPFLVIWSFLAIFGHFWQVPAGEPQTYVEEGRFCKDGAVMAPCCF